jgi:hypothetical protein
MPSKMLQLVEKSAKPTYYWESDASSLRTAQSVALPPWHCVSTSQLVAAAAVAGRQAAASHEMLC